MSDDRLQRLSALMDDELPPDAARRALDALVDDADERAAWSRYHLIGDVIGDRHGPVPATALAGRVSQALKTEPIVLAPRRRRLAPAVRTLGGLAIAASVAVMAVLGLRGARQEAIDLRNSQLASAPALPTLATRGPARSHISMVSSDGSTYRPQQQQRWNAGRPEVIYRLEDYLRDHSALAAREGVQGALAYRHITVPADNR